MVVVALVVVVSVVARVVVVGASFLKQNAP